eukprot:569904-Amphidinium_carterae.1
MSMFMWTTRLWRKPLPQVLPLPPSTATMAASGGGCLMNPTLASESPKSKRINTSRKNPQRTGPGLGMIGPIGQQLAQHDEEYKLCMARFRAAQASVCFEAEVESVANRLSMLLPPTRRATS